MRAKHERIRIKSRRILTCRLLCMAIILLLLHLNINAQKISASLDRNKILLSEQVILQLKAEDINAGTTFIQDWFVIDDTADHVQVVKADPVDTIEVNGLTTYLQKITITSFDSGKCIIAPMSIVLQNRTTGKKTAYKTDSVFLEVLPVDVSSMIDYHDIKDILEVEAKTDYTLYVIIGLSVIILLVVLWFLNKYFKKKKIQPQKIAYKGTALETALEQIKELQRQSLAAKLFYTELTDILKKYFQQQLNVSTSQATSDELMIMLVVYLQDEKKRTAFYQLLRLTDAVKFAKYLPSVTQNEEAVETAITSLQHIDKMIKTANNNV